MEFGSIFPMCMSGAIHAPRRLEVPLQLRLNLSLVNALIVFVRSANGRQAAVPALRQGWYHACFVERMQWTLSQACCGHTVIVLSAERAYLVTVIWLSNELSDKQNDP